jgi:hypothetical protein
LGDGSGRRLLAEHARQHHAPQAPAAHPAADRHRTRQTAPVGAAFLVLVFDLFAFAFAFLSALADQMGENQPAQAPAAGGAADEKARQAAVLAATFLVLDAFALIFFLALLAKVLRKQRPAPASAPHHPGAQQEADKLAIFAAAFLVLHLFALAFLAALADEVGDDQPAQAPTARGAADEKARQAAVLAATFLVLDAFALIFVLALLAKAPRKQRPAPASAPHHPRPQQEADKLAIFAAAFLVLHLLALAFLAALADQVGDDQPAQAPAAGGAADEKARYAAVLAATFLVLLDPFALVLAAFTQEMGHEQATHALPPQRLAASEHPNELVFVSVGAIKGRCIGHGGFLPAC